MNAKRVGLYALLITTLALSPHCQKKLAGSVTETGNVTGKVIIKESNAPAAGARIALFKKKSAIISPIETFAPEIEVYADRKGNFSIDIDDGTYTMLASIDTKCAFIDNLIAGTDNARSMTVTLQNPGTIQGMITNALELRETGSVVVRVLGTDIVQLVDNSGKFTLENIPAGELTLVLYSTAIPVFSPIYQDVTIAPDSIKDISAYTLSYTGIPLPKSVKIAYDTAKQTIAITWQSVAGYDDFQEYGVLRGIGGKAEHELKQIVYTADTIYRDHITFLSMDPIHYEYAVRVNNKLGQYGQYYGIYSVTAVPYQSPVDAGEDTTVEIGAEVKLFGAIAGPKTPIVKMEWKIGAAGWVISDSGEGTFTAGTTLTPDTTACVFRVTDSLGNILVDTVIIRKEMSIRSYGLLPGLLPDSNGYPGIVKFKNKFWYISGNSSANFSIWSTIDFTTWSLEKASWAIANKGNVYGEFVSFKDQLFILNLDSNFFDLPQEKSYRSNNGRDWSEMTIIPPPLESLKMDSSYVVYDYVLLNSHFIEHHSKLFALLKISVDDTHGGQAFGLHLVSSADGAAWEYAGMVPTYDYRLHYILLSCNNNLYFVEINGGQRYTEQGGKAIYRSADEGKSWTRDALWDVDESTNPDRIILMKASDSVIFAYYYQNRTVEMESFLFNGKWNHIPLAIVEKQQLFKQPFGEQALLAGNRFYWTDSTYTVKSIKLF